MVGAKVYSLPEGLAPGTKVRTLALEGGGNWRVQELAPPARQWLVPIVLLEVDR